MILRFKTQGLEGGEAVGDAVWGTCRSSGAGIVEKQNETRY